MFTNSKDGNQSKCEFIESFQDLKTLQTKREKYMKMAALFPTSFFFSRTI